MSEHKNKVTIETTTSMIKAIHLT